MTALTVARMGAEVLKRRAAEVTDFSDPALKTFIEDLVDTMHAERGVGLAAPQVSKSVRIVVFFVPAARNKGQEIPITVMINPVITPLEDAKNEAYEACLSVPGLTGMVPRFTHIKYSYQDISGKRVEREAHDFHARVVQHECDHLDGILYPQRVVDMTTLAFSDVLQAEADAQGKELELDEEG